LQKNGDLPGYVYHWKKKYGGLGVSELRRLRQLEKENNQLKKLVADLSLDKQMLQDVIKKSYKTSISQTGRCMVTKPVPYH
jgi:putative transposase